MKSYAADPSLEEKRRATLHAIESAATRRRPRRRGSRHGRARGAPRRRRRALPPPHDGARGRELRPPAPRERHPRAPLLGEGLRAPAKSRRRAARDGGQERGLLGHAARRRAGVRGDGGRRQDPRALERNGHVHRKGRRLPALEARRPRDRLRVRGGSVPRRRRLARVPRLGRRLAALPDPARRGGRRPLGPRTLRPRHGRHQRHRRAPVLSPEGRPRGGPARRLPRGRRPVRPLRVRDGRADAGLRGGARRRAHGRGSRAPLRRDVGPPRARRESRRSPRPARREGEGPDSRARERASRGRPGRGDRGRRAARLHDAILAEQGHRVRSRRGARLRGRHGALPPVRRRARREHLSQARGDRPQGPPRRRGDRRPRGPSRVGARRRALGRREDVLPHARHAREGGRVARGVAPRPARARGRGGLSSPVPHAPDRAGEGRDDAPGAARGAPGRLRSISRTFSACSACRCRSRM